MSIEVHDVRQAIARLDGHTYIVNFPAGFHGLAVEGLAADLADGKLDATAASMLAYEIGKIEKDTPDGVFGA